MDLSMCAPAGTGLKLLPRSLPRLRPRLLPSRDVPNGQHWRTLGTWQRGLPPPVQSLGYKGGGREGLGTKPRPQRRKRYLCEECGSSFTASEAGESLEFLEGNKGDIVKYLLRSRRQTKWENYDSSLEGRTTTVAGFIDWGPTGVDGGVDDENNNVHIIVSTTKAPTTLTTTTTSTTTRSPQRTHVVVTTIRPRRQSTSQTTVNLGVTAKPQKPFGDTPGRMIYTGSQNCGVFSNN